MRVRILVCVRVFVSNEAKEGGEERRRADDDAVAERSVLTTATATTTIHHRIPLTMTKKRHRLFLLTAMPDCIVVLIITIL